MFLVVLLAMILIRWELVIKGPFEVKASQHVWVRATVPGQLKALYFTEGMHVNKGDKLALLDSTEYSLKLEESKAKLERAKAKLRLLKSGARREEIERAEARLKEAKAMLELMQKGFRPEEIQKAQARLNQARAHLELVMKGPRLEDIRRAEKRVAGLKIGWEYERRRYLRTKGLYEQGFATLDEYEKAKTRMEISYEELEQARSELRLLKAGARPEEIERAQAMVQEAELELRVLKAGSRPEEIEQARAKVKQVESELELLRAGSRIEEIQQAQANVRELEKAVQLYELYKERTVIRAPISGVIVTLHPEEKLGKMVSKGEDICEIADIRTLRVEIRVSEKDAADFREGSPVYLKFSSLPYDVFEGYGLALAPAILEGNPHNILIVTCKLDNPLFKLKPGMSGWARIYAGDRSLLQLMVRKLVRLIRVEFWWWFGS
jgi:HlyD family secretion protein